MHGRIRAITTCMHPPNLGKAAFTRQVVFRISPDEWPLLEQAAAEHGSIQAAVLAGLQALADIRVAAPGQSGEPTAPGPEPDTAAQTADPAASEDPNEEVGARQAAALLGIKASTVSGYIRSGRLPGRYDDTLGDSGSGWVTTRGAVDAYRRERGRG